MPFDSRTQDDCCLLNSVFSLRYISVGPMDFFRTTGPGLHLPKDKQTYDDKAHIDNSNIVKKWVQKQKIVTKQPKQKDLVDAFKT